MAKFNSISITILCVFFCLVAFTSCDAFSTSLGTNYFGQDFSRDYENRFTNIESTEDLADLATNDYVLRDSNACIALINELSTRSEADITSLTLEAQESIMNLLVTAVLPLSTIVSSLQGLTTDTPTSSETALIDSIVESAKSVDPSAIVTLLGQNSTLATADTTSLMITSIALITQIVSTEMTADSEATASERFIDIKNAITSLQVGTTAEQAVSTAITDNVITSNSADQLEAIINVVLVLGGESTLTYQDEPIDRSGDVSETSYGGFNLGALLGIDTSTGGE